MKFGCFAWRNFWVAALVFLSTLLQIEAKSVKLRNEHIPAKATKPAGPKAASPATPVNGLFLVQFAAPITEKIRQQLETAQVDLLQYVPDDTYVARFHGARLDQVRALPLVQWIGEYRHDHKIHKRLQPSSAAAKGNANLQVAVLLAPRAPDNEVAEARRALAGIRQESSLKSGTILRGTLNSARLEALARSHAVLWIESSPDMKLFDEVASKIVAGDGGPQTLYTESLGFDGSGVQVAVADSGLHNGDAESMHPDLFGRTPAFFQYGTLTDAADEHSHGTHVAGIVAGNGAVGETDENGALYGLGVAPGAEIIAQRLFDGVGNYEPPPSFEKMTRDATRAGADIGSNSWGDDTQGRYDISAMEFDELVRDADALMLGNQQYILEFSAGNAGPAPQTIGSPAVAKNVIATGASQNDRADFFIYDLGPDGMADFSSRGPCEDGRIKPDIVAPGTWIASLQSASATDEFAWSSISANYQYQGGTSQAGPHASGAAAVFVQYYRQTHGSTPSPALVKAALINCAVDMDDTVETDPIPNMDEGWGRIDLPVLVDGGLNYDFVDQSVLLTNGAVYEYRVLAGIAAPLKATLAYTDVPGFPGAIAALVNDLDLEVVAPDGRIYYGNQFEDGESVADFGSPDAVNNVEQVLLYEPLAGEYVVRVRARNIPQDALIDTPAVDQDFALVISGETPPPGVATLFLDRLAYRAGTPINVRLVDSDLAGQSSVSVTARSSTDTAGEVVLLHPANTSGNFTGAIATATGPALPDGVLQMAHGDAITFSYFDASPGTERTATARCDLVPPTITTVGENMLFGQTLITWQTDEPASSIVRYGTTASLGNAVTNASTDTDHTLALPDLVPGTTYYFVVVSADQAGNASTNNNGGSLFSFVARQPRTLLLVDAYVATGEDPFIPVETYTDTLNQIGVSYEVWNVSQMGRSPNLGELRPHRVVIWRFNDGIWSTDTFTGTEQATIRNYLNAGGAFFLASMEQLSRIGEGAFRSQVLQISSFGEDLGVPDVEGSPGDIITSGLSLLLEYSHYHTIYHELLGLSDDLADTIVPNSDSAPIFFDTIDGSAAGLRYPRDGLDAAGRLVFLPFPLDAVSATDPDPNNRATLLRNILKFLVPGFNGNGSVALNSTAYTIPSVATVEVGDSDLAISGSGAVTAYSTSDPGGLQVALAPTAIPNLFRGTIDIISATNAPVPGKLSVLPGDQVWVEYNDVSSGIVLTDTAEIDVVAPGIFNVGAEPDYRDAVVFWQTSEPADSVVQFGESALLGRTASDFLLKNSHEVTLPGLLPDKTYYYKVTSRDAAGNVVVDDNNGQLYTFRTLQPLVPPWFDDLNSGGADWTVFSGDESQGSWSLGTPAGTTAHSPPHAWGSNLSGQFLDYVETFLISPAIYLTNGNIATLKFWHYYEFADFGGFDIELGQVLLITNNNSTPITLADFGDSSFGWVEEQIDLSPHMGKVVYVVWYYLLFSFDYIPRTGWIVDDVSIDTESVATGSVEITNNIWQASFVLSGPMYRKAGGNSLLLTNAPPGDYLLEFADLPYYQTPPPQTKTLASGETITFAGNYTFSDANNNGIPDAWEQRFFTNVSTNRTALTDTDGDGMTDYGEFVAGTDPTQPPRAFRVNARALSTNLLRLEWDAVPGQMYRILNSTNLLTWTPASTWQEALGNKVQLDVSTTTQSRSLFRVQAGATNSPPGLHPNLKLSSTLLPSGAVQINWPTAPGHAYRLLSSTNAATWIPASSWFHAQSTMISTNLPQNTLENTRFFRVEAAP